GILVQRYIRNLHFHASTLLICDWALLYSPTIAGEDHVPDFLHVLGAFRHVEDHVEGLVNAPDASSLIWLPTDRSQLLGHVGLVHVLTDLAGLDQVHDLISKGLDLDVDLVVSIRRLAFNRPGFAPDCFP